MKTAGDSGPLRKAQTMKRFGRSASLVALLLLASLGTASAECAWLLWLTREGFDPSGRSLVEAPHLYASYVAPNDCVKELDQLERMLRVDNANRVTRLASTSLDLIVLDPQTLNTKRGQSWRCSPDTIDPRGPKGAGR